MYKIECLEHDYLGIRYNKTSDVYEAYIYTHRHNVFIGYSWSPHNAAILRDKFIHKNKRYRNKLNFPDISSDKLDDIKVNDKYKFGKLDALALVLLKPYLEYPDSYYGVVKDRNGFSFRIKSTIDQTVGSGKGDNVHIVALDRDIYIIEKATKHRRNFSGVKVDKLMRCKRLILEDKIKVVKYNSMDSV